MTGTEITLYIALGWIIGWFIGKRITLSRVKKRRDFKPIDCGDYELSPFTSAYSEKTKMWIIGYIELRNDPTTTPEQIDIYLSAMLEDLD